VSSKDPQTGETLIEICSETFSHFYIPYYKRKKLEEEKRRNLQEQIQREKDRIRAEMERREKERKERERARVFNHIKGLDKFKR